jgi:glycosyltransferase involved in cell wall biosynthesis
MQEFDQWISPEWAFSDCLFYCRNAVRGGCSVTAKSFLSSTAVNLVLICRTFVLPPFQLIWELLKFWKPVEYDIAHIVAPLCLGFVPVLPLLWLRGIKIYVSYHVYLEYYRVRYFGDGTTLFSMVFNLLSGFLFPLLYYIPLTIFADCVGIPSQTADFYVFDYSRRVHVLKSGLDTNVFHPSAKCEVETRQEEKSTNLIHTVVGSQDNVIENIRLMCDGGPILLSCGRLAVEKHTCFLIEALANPLLKDATLVIVGDGPCRAELEQLAIDVVGRESVYSANLNVNLF